MQGFATDSEPHLAGDHPRLGRKGVGVSVELRQRLPVALETRAESLRHPVGLAVREILVPVPPTEGARGWHPDRPRRRRVCGLALRERSRGMRRAVRA